jgi:hypothetical protein
MFLEIADLFMEYSFLREILISLEMIAAAFFFFYMLQFFNGMMKRKRKGEKLDWMFSWASFFLGQLFLTLVLIFGDYYQGIIPQEIIERFYIVNVAKVFGLLGLIAISVQIEKVLEGESYFINSTIITIISLCVIFFYNFPSDYLTIFISIAYGSTVLMIYAAINSRVGKNRRLHRNLNVFLTGYITMFIGNLFKSDLIISLFTGLEFNALIIRLIGDILVISSIFILNYSFESFPTIMELNWKLYLLEIHILSANGIEIHCNNFETIKRKIDPDLVGMAVTGISDLIKEVTGSTEDLNMIDQKDFKIIFKKSDDFVIFLLATEPLEIYEFKLIDLMEDITKEFGKKVENWGGDLIKFKGIEKHVLNHFN